jgi:DCN1-like protein 1/2
VFQGQKSLALDTAIGMWQLLFAEKQWPQVDHWCQFLQVAYNSYFDLIFEVC